MFTGTGYTVASSSVNGAFSATGLLQFDGVGTITVNAILSGGGTTAPGNSLTGSYSLTSTCVGSATLTNAKGAMIVMTFSVTSSTKTNNTDFFLTLAQSGSNLLSGSGHPVFGQPVVTTAANRGTEDQRAAEVLATLWSAAVDGRAK